MTTPTPVDPTGSRNCGICGKIRAGDTWATGSSDRSATVRMNDNGRRAGQPWRPRVRRRQHPIGTMNPAARYWAACKPDRLLNRPLGTVKRTRRNVYSLRGPYQSFGCPGHEVILHSEGRSALRSRALVRYLVPAERALRIWVAFAAFHGWSFVASIHYGGGNNKTP
jgi:hypothetical protein